MMKRIFFSMVLSILLAGALASCSPFVPPVSAENRVTPTMPATKPPTPEPVSTATPAATLTPVTERSDPKNIAYLVDGKQVTLKNGLAEMEAAPGSQSKIVTRYFGNDAVGDLNGDGREDVIFLLIQNMGGSGAFFYVVAALGTPGGYTGTNAVFLGDRIAPQSTSIKNGSAIVNFAERRPEEPFTAAPSVGVSKTLKIVEGKLVDTADVLKLTGRKWVWTSTKMNDGTLTMPKKPGAFALAFSEDGKVSGTTDCNNFFGSYTLSGSQLSFSALASTKMYCEGSEEGKFLQALGQIDHFMLDVEGQKLVLLFKMDSGSMIFQ